MQKSTRRLLLHALQSATILAAFGALSASAARADEWCGYAAGDNAVIQCGYTTAAHCESVVGKGGMCFVDPDTAFSIRAVPRSSAANTATKIATKITVKG